MMVIAQRKRNMPSGGSCMYIYSIGRTYFSFCVPPSLISSLARVSGSRREVGSQPGLPKHRPTGSQSTKWLTLLLLLVVVVVVAVDGAVEAATTAVRSLANCSIRHCCCQSTIFPLFVVHPLTHPLFACHCCGLVVFAGVRVLVWVVCVCCVLHAAPSGRLAAVCARMPYCGGNGLGYGSGC